MCTKLQVAILEMAVLCHFRCPMKVFFNAIYEDSAFFSNFARFGPFKMYSVANFAFLTKI